MAPTASAAAGCCRCCPESRRTRAAQAMIGEGGRTTQPAQGGATRRPGAGPSSRRASADSPCGHVISSHAAGRHDRLQAASAQHWQAVDAGTQPAQAGVNHFIASR